MKLTALLELLDACDRVWESAGPYTDESYSRKMVKMRMATIDLRAHLAGEGLTVPVEREKAAA